MKGQSEYIGFYDINSITEIRCTRKKGHIQIKFLDTENQIEYSVNLHQKNEKSKEFSGKFISHSIDTKEEISSGVADCKLIKDENDRYLIGYWMEDTVQYGWTLLLSKQMD